jgi:hypothetical protein
LLHLGAEPFVVSFSGLKQFGRQMRLFHTIQFCLRLSGCPLDFRGSPLVKRRRAISQRVRQYRLFV